MSYPAIDNLPPVHPGEFLRDELQALGLSATKFAAHLGVPTNAITAILHGNRGISAKMALRLGRAFGTSVQYWLNLQDIYDVKVARSEIDVAAIAPLLSLHDFDAQFPRNYSTRK
jgi:addiction module HigA family antidote